MDNEMWLACSLALVICLAFGGGCLWLGSRPDREEDE